MSQSSCGKVRAICGAKMENDGKSMVSGVLAGARTAASEIFPGADGAMAQGELIPRDPDEAMLETANPFPSSRTMPRGGSRKGIPNKRNAAMREVYLRMGLPHPMFAMGQILREGVDGLRARLVEIDPEDPPSAIDVFDQYRKVAADLLPYLEGKAPQVTADGKEQLPVLVLGELAAGRAEIAQAREDGAMAIDDDLDLQFQRLSDSQRAASHGDASQGDSQDADNAGITKP